MQVRPHLDPLTRPPLRVQFPLVTRNVDILHCCSGPLQRGGLSRSVGDIGELSSAAPRCVNGGLELTPYRRIGIDPSGVVSFYLLRSFARSSRRALVR